MAPETLVLLSELYEQRNAISQKLDKSLRCELAEHIESSVSSGEISDEFCDFCDENLKDFTDLDEIAESERIRSDDKGKLTPSDVEKYSNELVRALKEPQSKTEGKTRK